MLPNVHTESGVVQGIAVSRLSWAITGEEAVMSGGRWEVEREEGGGRREALLNMCTETLECPAGLIITKYPAALSIKCHKPPLPFLSGYH